MEHRDDLVGEWLPLPDVAERLGTDVGKVRRLLQERQLVALRTGDPKVWRVPARLLGPDGPLHALRGTLTVLADAGYSDEEAVRWLFTPDETLPGSPVDALQEGRHTEVRRRAQSLGF